MQPHEVAIPIMFFLSIAAMAIIGIVVRHRERMTMVEKGMSSEDIKSLYARTWRRDPLTALKWGILFVMGGVGVMLGGFLVEQYDVKPPVIIGMMLLFIGCGLVFFYTIATKKIQKDQV